MKKLFLLLSTCLVLGAGCTIGDEKIKITGIEFVDPPRTIAVHEEYELQIRHFPEDAPAPVYDIGTGNQSTAIVADGMVLIGIGVGTTTIMAIVNDTDVFAECTITVTDLIPSEIRFAEREISIQAGTSERLEYSVIPSNSTLVDLAWSSSNKSVVEVDSEGQVTAKAMGEAEIMVEVVGTQVIAKCKVTVLPAPVTGVLLSVDGGEPMEFGRASVLVGRDTPIVPVLLPEGTTTGEVVFASSDNGLARVEKRGDAYYVIANSIGFAEITATTKEGGYSAKCEISVKDIDAFATINLSLSQVFSGIGLTNWMEIDFNTNVGEIVTINKLTVTDAYGRESFDFVDLPGQSMDKLTMKLPIESSNIWGWYAEIEFTWKGKQYLVAKLVL